MFVRCVPTEATLRIWDAFLCDGKPALFRYALAVLHLNRKAISELQVPPPWFPP
jgi:hypothetical protein